MQFLRHHRGTIAREPSMIFQLAANSTDGAAAEAAIHHRDSGLGTPSWIKWMNPDTDMSILGRWSLKVHEAAITAIAVSSDGLVLATASKDRSAHLWDLGNGRVLCSLPKLTQQVSCIALSHSLSHIAIGDADGSMKIWQIGILGTYLTSSNARTLKLAETPDFGSVAHRGAIRSIIFLRTPDWVVTVGDDSSVKVWLISSVTLLRVLKGHEGPVNCVRLLRETARKLGAKKPAAAKHEKLYTCGDDGTVREWNVTLGNEVRQFEGHR